MKTLGFLALLALSACATTAPTLPAPKPQTAVQCLPLKAYSPADQQALLAQLKTLPPDSPLALAIRDYLAMRDADRACMEASQ